MKKIVVSLAIFLSTTVFSFSSVSAEVIKSFHSEILVNTDASVLVTETIVYDSQGADKHGIFRDVTPLSSDGKKMAIKMISVTDPAGAPIQWQREISGKDIRFRIGSAGATFNGLKTYVITYSATNAVAHLKDGKDEIYWNVTGNAWPFGIEKTTAQVILPNTIHEEQRSCYVGVAGSNEGCFPGSGQFYSSRAFAPGEGMTVAVGFPAGFIFDHVPTLSERILDFLKKFWSVLIPLLLFIIMYRSWNKKGRDPLGRGTIVPQYDTFEGLTPIEMSIVLSDKFRNHSISAEIVYLATKGYIKIVQSEKKTLGFMSSRQYELFLLKEIPYSSEVDQKIVESLFGENKVGATVSLSELQNSFYQHIPKIKKSLIQTVLDKKYYTNLPDKTSFFSFFFSWIMVFIFGIFFGFPFFRESGRFTFIGVFVFYVSIFISLIIFSFFKSLMSALSIKGVEAKEYFLGLQEYIAVAEKNRITFHNAPEKNPQLFEKLLPYAMVFGLEKDWAKEFKDIYITPPSWYESGTHDVFNVMLFTDNLSSFSSSVTSLLGSAPSGSSGGSSGGGFSGGGGGGGGGGSW